MTELLPDDELLTLPEVAKLLRVDIKSVRRWIEANALEAVRLPNSSQDSKRFRYRVRKRVLDELIIEEL